MKIIALPRISLFQSVLILIVALFASLGAFLATPVFENAKDAPSLETFVPRQFGDWREVSNPYAQVKLTTDPNENLVGPYDQTVMRTYVNSKGEQVMLALAWVRSQRQEVKVHRPELCYAAQGYIIQSDKTVSFDSVAKHVKGKHMVATSNLGGEAVAYWIRIGSIYSESAYETRTHIFTEGLRGNILDGILVRASMKIEKVSDSENAFRLLHTFLADLVAATPANARTLLTRS
jgi:EpsI family protein